MQGGVGRFPRQTVGLAVAIVMASASCSALARPSASTSPARTLASATLPPATLASSGASQPRSTSPGRASISTTVTPNAPGPPVAQLAAEGGDPTAGQLGTYTWGDGGSDSPWLPGARIAVGSGEPLMVTFTPATRVGSWRARAVPSTSDEPAGAIVLAQGTGAPRFDAPEPGTWTVEVRVVFANGAGTASYFWRLAVD